MCVTHSLCVYMRHSAYICICASLSLYVYMCVTRPLCEYVRHPASMCIYVSLSRYALCAYMRHSASMRICASPSLYVYMYMRHSASVCIYASLSLDALKCIFHAQCRIYRSRWAGSVLVRVIVRRLFGVKPLHEPMLSIGPLRTNVSEIRIEIQNFSNMKMDSKCRLWNGGRFVQRKMSWRTWKTHIGCKCHCSGYIGTMVASCPQIHTRASTTFTLISIGVLH